MKNIVELGQFINQRTSEIDDLYHEIKESSPIYDWDYYVIKNDEIEFTRQYHNGDNDRFCVDIDLYTSDNWKEELTEIILNQIRIADERSEKIRKDNEEREYRDYIKLKNKFENGGN